MMRFFFMLCFIAQCSLGFSQVGTYELGQVPKEARIAVYSADGAFELPIVIYKATSKIKLKRFGRVIIIRNEDEDDEQVSKGNWVLRKGIIEVSMVNLGDEIIKFVLVKYESGTYLKPSEANQYYKKE